MDYVNTPTNLVRFKLDKSIWELQSIKGTIVTILVSIFIGLNFLQSIGYGALILSTLSLRTYFLNWNRNGETDRNIVSVIILSFILCFVSKQAGFYEECIKKALLSGLKNKENPMDYLQREYKCCGWNGVMDYPEEEIPESCCIGNCESENYFPGCKSVLKLFKTNYL